MGAQKKWLFTLFSAAFLSLLLLLLCSFSNLGLPKPFPSIVNHGTHYPPSFAYYISGGRGDKDRILRLLLAVYHPRNHYLLHLDVDASDDERTTLVSAVKGITVIRTFGNVDVMRKPDRLTYMGASNIAATLHAVSILLKLNGGWNWFIQLSAADYPLMTQDVYELACLKTCVEKDRMRYVWNESCALYTAFTVSHSYMHFIGGFLLLLDLSHAFSSFGRGLNFVDHSSDLGWKEVHRFQPIVVDPGIYLARRSQIFHATEKRPMPDAFKIFTGSQWVTLSRSFLEYCILGWDNLPRILLMYFNNVMLSEESYFQSIICNSPEFVNTTINSDLRYMIWDNPPRMEPHFLNTSEFDETVQSGAAFARQFKKDDPILDMIDESILKRRQNQVVPGAWCTGRNTWWMDPCSRWGDVNVVKPGPQANKFEEIIINLLEDSNRQVNQCK